MEAFSTIRVARSQSRISVKSCPARASSGQCPADLGLCAKYIAREAVVVVHVCFEQRGEFFHGQFITARAEHKFEKPMTTGGNMKYRWFP